MANAFCVYLTLRSLLGLVDFTLDLFQSASLFSTGHSWWATLTLVFPVAAVAIAALSVFVARVQSGNPMGCAKFSILTLRAQATVFEGLMESAPELVLQVSLI